MNTKTRELLLKHCKSYPSLQAEDVFKYLFQSETVRSLPTLDDLDGDYTRVHVTCLSPETLARLFCLSAKKEENGVQALEKKLEIAAEMVESGSIPLDKQEFSQKLAAWREKGYPALHHSAAFRDTYHPAYRVIANKYVKFLDLFSEIDCLLANGGGMISSSAPSNARPSALPR